MRGRLRTEEFHLPSSRIMCIATTLVLLGCIEASPKPTGTAAATRFDASGSAAPRHSAAAQVPVATSTAVAPKFVGSPSVAPSTAAPPPQPPTTSGLPQSNSSGPAKSTKGRHVLLPNVGTSLVQFGATPAEVERALGPPDSVEQSERTKNRRSEHRSDCHVLYSEEGKVIELTFWRPAALMLNDRNLLEGSDQVKVLMALDDQPMTFLLDVYFFRAGVSVSGFHHPSETNGSEHTISISAPGVWDKFKDRAEPYRPER